MELGLKVKKALVTGGGRGIGRAIALALAKEGARVSVFSRTGSDVRSLVREMNRFGKGHYGVSLDLLSARAPSLLSRALKKNFGDPDIVVHNLGSTLEIKAPGRTPGPFRPEAAGRPARSVADRGCRPSPARLPGGRNADSARRGTGSLRAPPPRPPCRRALRRPAAPPGGPRLGG